MQPSSSCSRTHATNHWKAECTVWRTWYHLLSQEQGCHPRKTLINPSELHKIHASKGSNEVEFHRAGQKKNLLTEKSTHPTMGCIVQQWDVSETKMGNYCPLIRNQGQMEKIPWNFMRKRWSNWKGTLWCEDDWVDFIGTIHCLIFFGGSQESLCTSCTRTELSTDDTVQFFCNGGGTKFILTNNWEPGFLS